ncbi:MAG: TonB-dependent receptor [Acidobacteria bacterium]|nr:TonB-dependent receptor [Acidobacteriota bacterium]
MQSSRLLFLVFFPLVTLLAQEFRATLTGRVVDPTDAPIAGVAIEVKNEGTNIAIPTKTDARGNYMVPMLTPGRYAVTAAAPGFRTSLRTGFPLTVAQTSTLDFKMELANVSTEVTVTADAPILEQSSERGGLIDAEAITEYPLNGRNPFMLSMLVPGVDYNGELVYQRPFDNGAIARWNINGSNANNEFLLDGAPNNAQAGGNNIAYVPPVDSVREFKIQTNAYDAQYGKSAGGIINVALKSGENKVHGALYEFARRNAFDANSFQNNARGSKKDGHFLDQYGIQLDGPVYIPKLYNGRNRTFFLFNYEGYHEGTPQPLVLSVPEPEMRQGDFSKLVDGPGRRVTIYDPTSTRTVNSVVTRDPFPNNIIPADRINPIAAKIVSFYPAPNTKTPGVAYSQQNYFASGGFNPANDDFYNMVFKFDQNFGYRHHAFFRQASNDRTEFRSTNGIRDKPGADGPLPLKRINDAYVMDWVSTLSSSMIFNPRVSFSRYIESNDATVNKQFDMTSLGFPTSLAASLPYNPGFGRYAMDDYLTLGKNNPSRNVTNTWTIAASITKITGTRSTKFGVDARWIQYALQNTGTVFQLSSSRVFTRQEYNRTDSLSGNSVAGFLLGTPTSGTVNYNAFFIYMSKYLAPWVQHDWKVSRRLTVNAGLRFDFNRPPNERFNRINRGFDTESVSPLDRQVDRSATPELPNPLKGGILFAGVNGAPRNASGTYYQTWQPRLGAAYLLTPRTVLRGGWGRFYSNPSNNFMQSFGFNNQTTMTVSPDSNRTSYPNMLNNPFPRINLPPGSADGLLTFAGRSFNFVNSNFHTPHTDVFSFGIQRALSNRARFEITYSGSRGNDQESTKAFNEQDDGTFRDRCNWILGGNPSYCDAGIPNPFRGLDAFLGTNMYTQTTISRNQLLRPFPQFSTFNAYMLNTGKTWYNSLQSLFTIRMRNGINLNMNYTFAKNLVRTGYLDAQNDVMQQGVTQYDRPHRFVTSMISQLPFGRGKRWLNTRHPIWSRFISGWENTLIFNIQSGMPWALPGNVMYLKDARVPFGWGQEKVQAIKPCVVRWNTNNTLTTLNPGIDFGCTETNWLIVPNYNPRYTPNYEQRLRLQTVRMADVSLNKMTQVTERFRLQFRMEVFNVANSFFVTTAMFNNTADSANFGILYKSTVSAPQSNYPRQMQMGIKLLW